MVKTKRRKIKLLSIVSMLSLLFVVLAPGMGAGPSDLLADEPELAPLLAVTLSPGDTAGATSATVTDHVYDSLVVNITEAEISTPHVGDPAPTAGDYLITRYESGADITAGVAAGNYLQVYAVDMEYPARIVGFYQTRLTEGDIKTADEVSLPAQACRVKVQRATRSLLPRRLIWPICAIRSMRATRLSSEKAMAK